MNAHSQLGEEYVPTLLDAFEAAIHSAMSSQTTTHRNRVTIVFEKASIVYQAQAGLAVQNGDAILHLFGRMLYCLRRRSMHAASYPLSLVDHFPI